MKKISIGILMGLLFISIAHTASAAVVISEVCYDPDGADSGREFIELYNNGSQPVDLSNWQVQWGGPTFDYRTLAMKGTIPASGFFLIGGEQVATDYNVQPDIVYALSFQNGGSASDGIRIYDGEHYYDTVIYDDPNTNGLPGDNGWNGDTFAPDVTGGHSIIRTNLSSDSDAMTDFTDAAEPTPMNSKSSTKQHSAVPEASSIISVASGIAGLAVQKGFFS